LSYKAERQTPVALIAAMHSHVMWHVPWDLSSGEFVPPKPRKSRGFMDRIFVWRRKK
jgi:hypothetical protein